APVVERIVPGRFLWPLVVTLGILVTLVGWRAMPATLRGRFRTGAEILVVVPVVVGSVWVALALGGLVERTLLAGNYRAWLLAVLALTYDQRNSLVVGIVMGFALLPIIFTITHDTPPTRPQPLRAGTHAPGA